MEPAETPPARRLRTRRLGVVPYRDAWALQRELAEQRKAGAIDDTLLLLEHPPVVTLGRDARHDHLKLTEAEYVARGIELVESDRGGDATYHGPGQAVVYVIIDLKPDRKDIRKYVRSLEQAMIDTCAEYGIEATRFDGAPGVWLPPDGIPDGTTDGIPGTLHGIRGWRKIGALGARVSRWVTHHGIALNVNTDLTPFELIVPCGIVDKGVTSLARELGRPVDLDAVHDQLARHIAAHFGRELVSVQPG